MATHDRRESNPVRDSLFSNPSRFNFYQAVRLLAPASDPDLTPIEEIDQALRFDTESGAQFPATDIFSLQQEEQQAQMTLATFGLTGPLGPMPQQHSNRVEAEARDGNTALKRFLGLFEHRFISLLYLVKQKFRVGLHDGQRNQSDQYRYLLNISGLPRIPGTRADCPHAPLLPFAGLLAGGKITAPGLVNILSTLLNTSVRIKSLQGAFVRLDPSVQARFPTAKANSKPQRLGDKVSLGGRVWNQAHGISLEIGPVNWQTANDWMPGNEKYQKLEELLLYTTNGQWQLNTAIKVEEDTIPNSQMSGGIRLGWNSWLKTRDGDQDVSLTHRTIKPNHFH
ncbi:MAG: type VI secretion system baseplate subunit TssG [Pseudomonadota bacterium]